MVKQMLEKGGKTLSTAVVTAEYQKKMVYSSDSEPASGNFVESAVAVYNKIIKDKEPQGIIYQLDAAYGDKSPFALVTNLHTLLTCAKTSEYIRWCVCSIEDLLMGNMLAPGDITNTILSGAKTGGKGLIHLLMLKLDIKNHIINEDMGANNYDIEAR